MILVRDGAENIYACSSPRTVNMESSLMKGVEISCFNDGQLVVN
jgi:hypothetical protein